MMKKLRDVLIPLFILGSSGATAAYTLAVCGLYPTFQLPAVVITASK